MNEIEIRDFFLKYVEPEKLEKFLKALHSNGFFSDKLLFWQEQLWKKFSNKYKIPPLETSQILELFKFCFTHQSKLQKDTVPIIYGIFRFTKSELIAKARYFPYSNQLIYGPCWNEPIKEKETLFCPQCRIAQQEWKEKSFLKEPSLAHHEKIILALNEKLEGFKASSRLERLAQYYRTWRIPSTSSNETLKELYQQLIDFKETTEQQVNEVLFHREASCARRNSTSESIKELFDIEFKNKKEQSILNHCRMHYIILGEFQKELLLVQEN